MSENSTSTSARPRRKTAGLFDIRNVIGALLALYGVVLILVWAFGGTPPEGTDQKDNLWTGIVLLVVGLFFIAWARLRPIVVRETNPEKQPLDKPPAAP
jgi:drug/metabolite transporter (DMT)-like permease